MQWNSAAPVGIADVGNARLVDPVDQVATLLAVFVGYRNFRVAAGKMHDLVKRAPLEVERTHDRRPGRVGALDERRGANRAQRRHHCR